MLPIETNSRRIFPFSIVARTDRRLDSVCHRVGSVQLDVVSAVGHND
jgi:hypothetical protein